MPGWLRRFFGRTDSAGRGTRGRGYGDGAVAPFAATPIGAAAAGGEDRDAEGGSDPQSTGEGTVSDAGFDGAGSCGGSCGVA